MFFITYIEAEIKMSNKICILGLQEFKDGGWEEGKERDGKGKIEESEGRGKVEESEGKGKIEESEGRGKVEKRERQDIKEGGRERGKGKGEGGRGDEYFIFAFPGCISTSVLLIRTALRVLCHRCINMVKVRNILKEYCNRFTYKLIHNLQKGFYKNVVFTIFQAVL